jgi:hypothetical protein
VALPLGFALFVLFQTLKFGSGQRFSGHAAVKRTMIPLRLPQVMRIMVRAPR